MTNPVRPIWTRLKEFLNRDIKVRESLPPYLLIGVLWLLSVQAAEESRNRDERRGDIELAIQTYENATEQYEDQVALRKDCIDDVNTRNNTVSNLAFIETYIRSLSPTAADKFAAAVKAQPNNQPKSIEIDCVGFPVPKHPIIPQILIDEGIIEPDLSVPQTD
jgi:hypothetical protein